METACIMKVIITTLGLETHWRGAITVANLLRNHGMEVVYLSNACPDEVIESAIQEDVDIIGVSVLSGIHLTLGGELLRIARQRKIKNRMTFIIGGVFPPCDVPKLKELGFDCVFPSGVTGDEIYQTVMDTVKRKGCSNEER
jgi:methylmalonyl-CoA mutase C-terminal domain/subunit